ncbi:MAG: hypothetical protein HYX67_10385 [Candidatus Melainabacteria bacterium]|nr:hypothetical protein [Candidatus Melainabacteria bacterium]
MYSPVAYTAPVNEQLIASSARHPVDVEKDLYTVNFNNISIIEFVRFASKITNLNFIFEEGDLQFNVTVVSEEQVPAKSVMAALSQVLRAHGIILLEEDGNVLLTKSTAINQIAPIISSDVEGSKDSNAAVVTRVFRIKNANVNTIAGIIRPMTSSSSQIEVSVETRQLIVTDITTNVDQIAQLLLSLDSPHTPLEVETYIVKNTGPMDLIILTQQILSPFAEGNPLLFIPQVDTNSIYIVSTPYLIEKAMTVMEDLDIPPKTLVSKEGIVGKTVTLYKPVNRTANELYDDLQQLADQLRTAGGPVSPLEVAIKDVRLVNATGTLLIIADDSMTAKIKDMLASLDQSRTGRGQAKSSFIIYNPQNRPGEDLIEELSDIQDNLQESGLNDPSLLAAINSVKWVSTTNSLIITGDPQSLERIQAILASIDSPQSAKGALSKSFFLYKLQSAHCEVVLEQLKNIADKLPPTDLRNQNLINTINKIECIKANNSLLINGSPDAIEQVKSLISEFDVTTVGSTGAQAFMMYKPKYLPAQEIQAALTDLATDLQASGLTDPNLLQTINSMRYVQQTDSLLFTGNQESLDKVQNLINSIDTSTAIGAIQKVGNITFLLYKIQYAAPDKLTASLKGFANELKTSTPQDKQLAEAINGVKWVRETNSLLFTGSTDTLQRIDELVKKFDIPSLQGAMPISRAAQNFVIYNPKYLSGDELIAILCEFMDNLMSSGVSDPGLFDTINNLKWISNTNSLLVSGDPQSVEKVDQLLVKFDIPGKETTVPTIESIDNTSFLVYKLQFHPGNDIQSALKQVAASMAKSASTATTLVDAINTIQWVEVTNSLLVTGPQDVLVKLKELISNLDAPLRQVFIEVLVIETDLNNTQTFGLQWAGQAQYFNKATMSTGNFPLVQSPNQAPVGVFQPTMQTINATSTPAGGVTNRQVPLTTGFDLGVIGDIIMHKGKSFISLGSLVNALQIDSDSTIILNPKIITQDNRQSTIFVGSNVPYTGSIVTNQSNSTVQTNNIEYRDVGVSLTITPILGDNDLVTMDIVHDISQVVSQPANTNSNQLTGITTSHAHMETRVHVPNNYFVALSGMINDSKTHYRTAIPCLGGLPVIGALFSENDRAATKNNIIIFVRPQIINSYEEYKKITEHQEWLYKDNARVPVLKEEFDEGIDMIKIPENE